MGMQVIPIPTDVVSQFPFSILCFIPIPMGFPVPLGIPFPCTSLYALKTLKAHGLHGQALCDVTQATLVAQLLYASPAWSEFIKADEKAKLQSILNKTVRYGFLTNYLNRLNICLNHQILLYFRLS